MCCYRCSAAVAMGDRGGVMKRLLLLVGVVALLAVTASNRSMAADAFGAWTNGLPTGWIEGPSCDPWVDYNCTPGKGAVMAAKAAAKTGYCDPYFNYKCLDKYLGDDFFTRFVRYYQLEWGKAAAPSDPSAPPGRLFRRRVAADPAGLAADAVHRVALWRYAEYRRDPAKFGRLAADGCARQYATWSRR